MSFPAQMEVNQEVVLPTPPQLDNDKIIRLKCQSLKEAGEPRISLLRQYAPTGRILYDTLKEKFTSLLANLKEAENPNIDEFWPLILGNLEGSSGTVDPMLLLTQYFGQAIENLKIEDMIKEKTKVFNYGVDIRKEMSVRETGKLESLKGLYNVKQIKEHRKLCQGIRSYIKSLRKLIKTVSSADEPIDITTSAYSAYVQFMTEELNFNKLKIPIFETMADEDGEMKVQAIDKDLTPLKQKKEEKKEDTASTYRNKEQNEKSEKEDIEIKEQKKEEKQERDQQEANNDGKNKGTRVRRTKEEIQRDRILKEQEKQAKRLQKEQKEKAKQLEKLQKEQERIEKQNQRQLEKEKERKIKQQEKEAKQREKQQAKEAKQRQRLEKQAEKARIEQQKRKKNNPGVSILNFFKPKAQNSSPSKQDAMKDQDIEVKENNEENEKQSFLSSILNQNTSIEECRSTFVQNRMKDQNCNFQPYYVNIVTHKSRLEFLNFLVNEERFKQYTLPHEETETGKYEDSSAEYEDLCGDMCDEMDAMSAQEDPSQDNSAIVPDSYFQVDQLSQESKDDVVINIDQGGQWNFSSPDHQKAKNFEIYYLYDDAFPLTLAEAEQSSELPISIKCDIYKEIHGFCGTKDSLIKALALITDKADKVPRSYLDNLIKETTTKRANQRIVKPEIIEQLNEQVEGFSKELEEIKARRDAEIMLELQEKVTEREKQIERLILEEAGTYYIVDLLQFLREKGYRMRKMDLINFIDSRVGPYWDDIRRRTKKMSVKESEKMSQFLKKQKEDKDSKQGKSPKEGSSQNGKEEKKPEELEKDGSGQQDQKMEAQ